MIKAPPATSHRLLAMWVVLATSSCESTPLVSGGADASIDTNWDASSPARPLPKDGGEGSMGLLDAAPPPADAAWPLGPVDASPLAAACDGIFSIHIVAPSPHWPSGPTIPLAGCCRDDGTCGGWAPSAQGYEQFTVSPELGCVTREELANNVVSNFAMHISVVGPDDGGPCDPGAHLADSGIDVGNLRNCGPLDCEGDPCVGLASVPEPSCTDVVTEAVEVIDQCGLIGVRTSSSSSYNGLSLRSAFTSWFEPESATLVGREESGSRLFLGGLYPSVEHIDDCDGLVPDACQSTTLCRVSCDGTRSGDCSAIRALLRPDAGATRVDGGSDAPDGTSPP